MLVAALRLSACPPVRLSAREYAPGSEVGKGRTASAKPVSN